MTGRDSSLVLAQLQASPAWAAARDRWAAHGVALLADDAAAAAAGTVFVAEAPAADVEAAAIADALARDPVRRPRARPRAGRDAPAPAGPALAAAVPARPRGGRRARSASASTWAPRSASPVARATAIGDSAVAVIDGRQATWTTGANGAIGGAWLVVDTFADGDAVAP